MFQEKTKNIYIYINIFAPESDKDSNFLYYTREERFLKYGLIWAKKAHLKWRSMADLPENSSFFCSRFAQSTNWARTLKYGLERSILHSFVQVCLGAACMLIRQLEG